jgi:16S rRNA (guanine(1405)-N(7))-methyltransferase
MLDLDAVVSAVAASKKYGALCEDTIRRVAELEMATAPGASLKSVVKATRRRLHQVYGAFEQPFDAREAYHWLEIAYRSGSQAGIEAACRHVLGLHQSARERLPIIDRFYQAIWEVTGKPQAILDLGCGLNPLALPWMGLAQAARIIALDIDRERADWLNRYLALAGLEPLARCQDLLANPPGDPADVALLLKMGPTLERQEPGSTGRLIERLQAPAIVVSFAVKSLGGHEKGMAGNYRKQFLELAAGQGWPATELRFRSELVFIVRKQVV